MTHIAIGIVLLVIGMLTTTHYLTKESREARKVAIFAAWNMHYGHCSVEQYSPLITCAEKDSETGGCRSCWIMNSGVDPDSLDRATELLHSCDWELSLALDKCQNDNSWIKGRK